MILNKTNRSGGKMRSFCLTISALFILCLAGCSKSEEKAQPPGGPAVQTAGDSRMTVAELKAMPKIDAHVHLRGLEKSEEEALLAKLKEHNMRWKTISTRGMNKEFLLDQIRIAERMYTKYPGWIEWDTSFSLEK